MALWNDGIDEKYYGENEKVQAAILEQYKLYVEMTDRISARRGLTNTFFLTLNTLVFTTIGVFWKDKPPTIQENVLAVLLAVAVGQCLAWWLMVRTYRQVNRAKFQVIGLLEQKLPASPWWNAEWKALGEGKSLRLYVSLSVVEQVVPILFAALYVLGFLLAR